MCIRDRQRWSVSDTAEYGDYVSGPRVIDPTVKQHMQEVLADIRSGAFATRFIADQDAGAPEFKALRAEGESHPIEAVGHRLRPLFAWVKPVDTDYVDGQTARLSWSSMNRLANAPFWMSARTSFMRSLTLGSMMRGPDT